MYHGTVIILTLGPSGTRASGLGIRGSPPPALCTYPCGGGWWGCGAQERERWCVERQDLMGKTPIYKSLRSARTEPRTPTSKKADRVTPFVPGISALRELLDKTMSKKNHDAALFPVKKSLSPKNL